jgi:hypothetical protein
VNARVVFGNFLNSFFAAFFALWLSTFFIGSPLELLVVQMGLLGSFLGPPIAWSVDFTDVRCRANASFNRFVRAFGGDTQAHDYAQQQHSEGHNSSD